MVLKEILQCLNQAKSINLASFEIALHLQYLLVQYCLLVAILLTCCYMEGSEQRKKRLKEMRMQADQAEVSGHVEGSGMPGFLSNPLIEVPSTMPSQDKSYTAPRFDFYTDPMGAFSSEKRSNANIQAAPDNFPPPNFGGFPMGQYSSPCPESTNPQMTPPTHVSPAAYRNPVWGGPRGPAYYNFPFHPSSAGTYPSPRFEPSGGPLFNSAAQDMTHRSNYSPGFSPGYRNIPSPTQGRGRGFGNTRSPLSGRRSGQRSSFQGHWSNDNRASGPDRFFKRSMVEDPWKDLEPMTWKAMGSSLYTFHTPEYSKTQISKSMNTKGEGSSTASVKSYSEPSLAEYLAAAFNEAANDAENV
ncbi:hypothetical protein RJT34_11961 [Clitoria ternatea]|uniref:Uncharacterized protein n=1 Tax=Clitoria ternatea TaxID=43366 RepID=A0AAN9PK10_CLITE